jgi:hypothetical protein
MGAGDRRGWRRVCADSGFLRAGDGFATRSVPDIRHGHARARMRPTATAILAFWLSVAALSAFADQPRLRPSRDVNITYISTAAGRDGRRLEQRVRWLAAAQTMRIDPPTTGLFVIIDYLARRMSVVREADRSVTEMAAPDDMMGVADNTGAGGYVRRGEDTVAGLACTDWETHDRDGRQAVLCITTDGVTLRAGVDGRTLVSAVSVQYAPQDPADFRVPADYAHRSAGAPR